MKKAFFTLAITAALGLGTATVNVSTAGAQGFKQKKIVVVKPAPKIVYVKPNHRPQHSNRNRNIGLGVGAAVIGAIIATEAARANSGDGEMSCRQLERRCDDGQNWACRRLEVREDC